MKREGENSLQKNQRETEGGRNCLTELVEIDEDSLQNFRSSIGERTLGFGVGNLKELSLLAPSAAGRSSGAGAGAARLSGGSSSLVASGRCVGRGLAAAFPLVHRAGGKQ